MRACACQLHVGNARSEFPNLCWPLRRKLSGAKNGEIDLVKTEGGHSTKKFGEKGGEKAPVKGLFHLNKKADHCRLIWPNDLSMHHTSLHKQEIMGVMCDMHTGNVMSRGAEYGSVG